MKYDIITMKYIFKYFDFCPLLLKNTAPASGRVGARVYVQCGRGGAGGERLVLSHLLGKNTLKREEKLPKD